MDDKVILLILFKNNLLRTNLKGYESCVCETDTACNLVKSSTKYFKDNSKSLQVTFDDLDAIFKAEYDRDSEELQLWEEVKNLNISDISSIEQPVIKKIKTQIKDYFFAEAFTDDVYDRKKLEELYDVLAKLSHLDVDEEGIVEDVTLDNVEECVDIYKSKNREGIKFFDERISDTLSSGAFDYGTLNVITAPPGNGKTMLILNQGVYVASQGKHVLHLALGDLTRRQLIIRLLAIITNNSMQQISMLSADQFKQFITKAKEKYSEVFEHLHCKTIIPNAMNGIELVKLIEKEQDRLGIHFDQISVDYDGNIETSISTNKKGVDKDNKSMYYEGADIYNLFASFAKTNETVIWILSQPKLAFWNSEKIPLEGLNDSSKKQHISDFIMSLGKKIPDESVGTLYISKNRHGSSNLSFKVNIDGSTQIVTPITEADWG